VVFAVCSLQFVVFDAQFAVCSTPFLFGSVQYKNTKNASSIVQIEDAFFLYCMFMVKTKALL
jgi:hypothetical protein